MWAMHLLPCANSVREAALQEPRTQRPLPGGRVLLVWPVPSNAPYEIDQMIHVYRPTRGTDNGEVLATDRCVNATRQQAVAAGMALAGAA